MASERVQRTIEGLLDEAEDSISGSDWSVVRDRAQNVLALEHENRDALAFLEAAEFGFNISGASLFVTPPPASAQAQVSDQPTSFAKDKSQAMGHFEDALAFCVRAGYRTRLVRSCYDYADILLQRKETGDREKSVSLLDESLGISTELGMRPLMERVLSRRDILKVGYSQYAGL